MDAEAFVRDLDARNQELLRRLAPDSTLKPEVEGDLNVLTLLKVALKNEIEATESAARWLATTPEIDVKLALARQVGDEAKHYRLIADRLRELGFDAHGFDPLAKGYGPLFQYLDGLRTTVERVAAGQFTLAAAIPGNLSLFYVGLVLLVIGNGFFKPNISTMVGDLYPQGDSRRDGAFIIFYMGINVGAFLAPLVCSTLGEDPAYGWRVGFFAAGVGMLLSVAIQLAFAQRYIGDVGRVPSAKRSLAMAGGVKQPLTQVERDRLRVIFVIFTFVVIFWATFEQAGGLILLQLATRHQGDHCLGAGGPQGIQGLSHAGVLATRAGGEDQSAGAARNVENVVGMGHSEFPLGFRCCAD